MSLSSKANGLSSQPAQFHKHLYAHMRFICRAYKKYSSPLDCFMHSCLQNLITEDVMSLLFGDIRNKKKLLFHEVKNRSTQRNVN